MYILYVFYSQFGNTHTNLDYTMSEDCIITE
jgi:hypothetical protein